MLSESRYEELQQNGLDSYYNRIIDYILDNSLPDGIKLTAYPIYSKDERNGITETEQQQRAGQEDAVYSGLITALKTDSIPDCYWQVLLQTDRNENPVKLFDTPVCMVPLAELPETKRPTGGIATADAKRQAAILSERIHLQDTTAGAALRMKLWGKYCFLKYGQLQPLLPEILDAIQTSRQERKAAEERANKENLLQQISGKFKTGTADKLIKKNLPPVSWIWDGVLQEQGAGVLAGDPKAGKTYFALALGLHAAQGKKYLAWNMKKTDVLYIALDGMSESRLKERIKRIAGEDVPENFGYFIPQKGEFFPTLDETPGTLDALKAIMLRDEQEKGLHYKLIIIDVYADILPQNGNKSLDAYRQGRAEMKNIVRFAADNNVFVLLIHHLNKGKDSDNPYNRISGSNALYSAVDAGFILSRTMKSKDTQLIINGRDQEAGEHVLQFKNGMFEYIGTAEDAARTYDEDLYLSHPVRNAIVELVNSAGTVEGTLQQISTTYETVTGKALAESAVNIGRFLSKNEDKLRELDGIKFTQTRGRCYTFTKVH